MKLSTLLAVLAPAMALGGHVYTPERGASSHGDLYRRAPEKAKNLTFDHLYNLQLKFLDNFLYPKNAIQVGSQLQNRYKKA